MARTKVASVPEVGQHAPEFHLPSAQGGQLRLSMRTARGPVVVVFYRPWAEEDVEYFKELAKKEEEINLAAATLVGIGIAEPDAAREFLKSAGIKSYVLYDYSQVATREWGLLEKDSEHGEYSRPAVFIVGPEGDVRNAWVGERPSARQLYDLIHEVTGLPAPPPPEDEEKPKKKAPRRQDAEAEGKEKTGAASEEEKPAAKQKLSPEEREKRKAERKAAREAKTQEGKGEEHKPQGSTQEEQTPEASVGEKKEVDEPASSEEQGKEDVASDSGTEDGEKRG